MAATEVSNVAAEILEATERLLAAIVRLVQSVDPLGKFVTSASEETRVWQRIEGRWKHVHFHRSPL